MRLVHRAHTRAPVDVVWELLAEPRRWRDFDLVLRRVDGSTSEVRTGDHLLAIVRTTHLRVPVDVVEASPRERLQLLIHTAPGLRQHLSVDLVAGLRGGTSITVATEVDGIFARLAAGPVWLGTAVTTRLLVRVAERAARARGRLAPRSGAA